MATGHVEMPWKAGNQSTKSSHLIADSDSWNQPDMSGVSPAQPFMDAALAVAPSPGHGKTGTVLRDDQNVADAKARKDVQAPAGERATRGRDGMGDPVLKPPAV